jgi:hypothetical protein
MLITTYNVNGINGRLPVLLAWLKEAAPDVVCLQELKAPDEKFPEPAIRAAGYGAIWHGKKAETASRSWRGAPSRLKSAGACPAIPTTRTAATSKRRSTASSSDASICRTATKRRDQNSISSCAGSNNRNGSSVAPIQRRQQSRQLAKRCPLFAITISGLTVSNSRSLRDRVVMTSFARGRRKCRAEHNTRHVLGALAMGITAGVGVLFGTVVAPQWLPPDRVLPPRR